MARKTKLPCQRCGDCCRVPAFLVDFDGRAKVEQISQEFNIEFIEVIRSNRIGTELIPLTSKQQLDLVETGKLDKATCPFLWKDTEQTVCLIYERRPLICKLFGEAKSGNLCKNRQR